MCILSASALLCFRVRVRVQHPFCSSNDVADTVVYLRMLLIELVVAQIYSVYYDMIYDMK